MTSVLIRPVALAACLVLVASGCKPEVGDGRDLSGYTFHPVKGRVVVRGELLTKGKVTFFPLADPNFASVGEIQPDGTFELTSILLGRKERGAPEGQYRVVVDYAGTSNTFFTVAPGNNYFTIEFGNTEDLLPKDPKVE
jgi:hypothetical protein